MPNISGWQSLESVDSADINAYLLRGNRNLLVNGDYRIAQRGTSFTSTGSKNNDATQVIDYWTLLSDGNNTVNVAQITTGQPSDTVNAISLTVATANRKFGVIQYVPQKNIAGLIGNTLTVSFKAKVSSTTNLDNLKCAIISWSGTADAYTTDVVSAWNLEGTNPTLVANWTYENTPVDLNPTTSFATYRVQGTVDTSSVANVAVFIWSDVTVTTATSDVLFLADVQAEIGDVATPFERRHQVSEKFLANDQLNVVPLKTASTTARDAQISSPVIGDLNLLTGASIFDGVYMYDGVGWRLPWIQPWGHVHVSTQGTDLTTSATTALTIANTTNATASLYGNRRLRLTFSFTYSGSALGNEFDFKFFYSSLGTQIGDPSHQHVTVAGYSQAITLVKYLTTPAAVVANTVFNVTVTRTSGAGTMTIRNGSYGSTFIVEDMGPAGVPI